MKRKKTIIFTSVAIVMLAVLFIGIMLLQKAGYIGPIFNNSDSSEDEYDRAIKVLNDTMPTTIFLYGDDLEFRSGMNVKKISEINKDSITADTEYSLLIINELESDVTMTSEAYGVIKEMLDNNPKFNFYYLGNHKISAFNTFKVVEQQGKVEGDLSVASTMYYGNRITWNGIWTENDKEVAEKHNISGRPAEFILTHIVMCYDTNN